MAQYLIPPLIGLLVVALSWVTYSFFGKPFTRFYALRDEVHTSLLHYANTSPVYEAKDPKKHPDWKNFEGAYSNLRKLASELQALAENHSIIKYFLTQLGYSPMEAADGLRGYSNTFGHPDARIRGEVAWNRDKIERALKFPLSYPNGVEVRD